jgi:hypothetical protein
MAAARTVAAAGYYAITGSSNGMLTAKRYISLLPAALLLNACAATATRNTVCHGQQLMIEFAPGVDVARTGFDAGLSRDAGVPVDYMRYLFDDYYLYCAELEGQESVLDDVLERLQGRPDIRAVEIDRIKRPQRKQ